jgi:thiosulfate sulfurtransferase
MGHMTVRELALWQGGDMPFTLLDVRRAAARQGDGTHIAGDQWLDPALWLDWKDGVAHGHEISQGLTAALRAMGIDARHLEGGIAAWKAAGRAVLPN